MNPGRARWEDPVACLGLGSGQWMSGFSEIWASVSNLGEEWGLNFLDPEQLPVLQVWIHGVASTHLPQPAHGPPGPAQPQHLGPVNKSPGWITNMWGLVRLLLAWLGGWGCVGRLAAPVPAWAGSRGHTGPALPRTRRSWVWNQFFVIEEYSGPEPVLIGKVRIDPSHVYCG